MRLWLCPLPRVMTAALTTGQLWAGRHAAGWYVYLMAGTRGLLPSCLAQQSQSSAGPSSHSKGTTQPREVAKPGMRELEWVRTRILCMPSLTRRGMLGQGWTHGKEVHPTPL